MPTKTPSRLVLVVLLGLLGGLVGGLAVLAPAADRVLPIGYLELTDDPRYEDRHVAARFPGQPWGRPFDGARVAIEESDFAGAAVGLKFELRRAEADDVDGLVSALQKLQAAGTHFFLLDAPGEVVANVAQRTRGKDLLLFNLTALEDSLRQERCQPHVFHVAPSHSMLMDALGQFLVSKKWRQALVLKGPRPEDAAIHAAFERAAKRFGIKIVDTRSYVLGKDPRERGQNNVALLTAGADHDVVVVVDADGEFARDVPYQTQRPRPVVGSAGLVPDWWNWAYERQGAPQLNNRFMRLAKRPMTGYDWSAWTGVKAIVETALRTQKTDTRAVAAYLTGDQVALDGFKGARQAFRPWDRQLRQALFLTTENWVVARAPLEGFLHAKNVLDTLGFDERDSRCRP
jgi:ABC transporter substrate binding protein (PQQ-dependent alcohol dehydrogenase system)